MGKYAVDVEERPFGLEGKGAPESERPAIVGHRSTLRTVIITAAVTFAVVAVIAGISSYFYWQHLKTTPQYSLALIVYAAKNDDQATVTDLIDINAVVDDFLPQIAGKAIELYGRGLPPDTLQKVARIAAPFMPAVKDRAREELPGAIRSKTSTFGDVPFAAMVLGADRYLDIKVDGDRAMVRSKIPEHSLELRMVRSGGKWKIAGLKDEELATKIAQRIGQEIVAIAVNGPEAKSSRLGVKNINELLREAEDIFK